MRPSSLTGLSWLASLPETDRAEMGLLAASVVADWGPDRFVQGTLEALALAFDVEFSRRRNRVRSSHFFEHGPATMSTDTTAFSEGAPAIRRPRSPVGLAALVQRSRPPPRWRHGAGHPGPDGCACGAGGIRHDHDPHSIPAR